MILCHFPSQIKGLILYQTGSECDTFCNSMTCYSSLQYGKKGKISWQANWFHCGDVTKENQTGFCLVEVNSLEVGVEPELFLSSLDAVGKRASRWRTGGTYITTTHKAHNDTHFQQALCSFGEEIQTKNIDIYQMNEVITQTQKCLLFYDWLNKAVLRSVYSVIRTKRTGLFSL